MSASIEVQTVICNRLWQKLQQPEISPQAVAKLQIALICSVSIPWGHHALLMEKIKDLSVRFWYMEQTIQNGWSRDTLGLMIKSDAYTTTWESCHQISVLLYLTPVDLARQSLKDPYIFDFLTLTLTF